ncbi:hypothetical protein [Leptospira phage LE4]|uniref:ASCH domain-containing protein n=1 Tax=Leptospira phage LE4 TaxID=2041383 RepID=A0A343LEH1_9CAUD|nr:hypothetical protein HWB34_gp68 [Leptospira phage LE4]ATN95081.1 hypothetical protein [Leptospira phage LE4]
MKQITKVLTIQQPYAWLIFNGKDVENRSWKCDYQGVVAIHSSMHFNQEAYEDIVENYSKYGLNPFDIPDKEDFLQGFVLGTVFMEGCIAKDEVVPKESRLYKYSVSPWKLDFNFHFCLQHPRQCVPVRMKGQQGMFNLPEDIQLVYP